MWQVYLIGFITILLILKLYRGRGQNGDLHRIPGPSLWSVLWSILRGEATKVDMAKIHLQLCDLMDQYGPIVRFPEMDGSSTVIVSDYDLIYQVLVKNGKNMAGRLSLLRERTVLGDTGLIFNGAPDAKWKTLRKVAHGHIRQFGEGVTDLQVLLSRVGDDMFYKLAEKENIPLDPRDIIIDAALKSMMFLVVGRIPDSDDAIVRHMRQIEYETRTVLCMNPSLSQRLLDTMPALRHTGLFSAWTRITDLLRSQDNLMNLLHEVYKSDQESPSLFKVFMEHFESESSKINQIDLKHTIFNLIFAGIITSTNVLHGMINLLAHNPHIQEKMHEEIQRIIPSDAEVTANYRHEMHYCKAVLLETLRYMTITPFGVPHRCCVDTKIGDYVIPADTKVITFLWNLHHDKKIWDDPEMYRPERFLDENGKIYPVDHPLRQRLLPFGAGPRVCLGESLATIRLFLWSTTLVKTFRITPAAGNEKKITDVNNFFCGVVLTSLPYEVLFEKRN